MSECLLCFKSIKLIIHHLSYYPEKVELICNECHEIINNDKELFLKSWIQYKFGDVTKYYETHPYRDNWKLDGGLEEWQKKRVKDGDRIICPDCGHFGLNSKFPQIFGICNECLISFQINDYNSKKYTKITIPKKMTDELQNIIIENCGKGVKKK
jgi:hypothetical protein